MACEAGVGRGRANLRYANWSAGEGGKEEARYQVAMAGEVKRLLERFVEGHCEDVLRVWW